MRLIVLFNLKPGTDVAEYERWAATTDLPTVRALPSVDDFQVYRTTGLLIGDGKPPYSHIEIIDVADMEGFGKDVASDAVQKAAAEFNAFAEAPLFIMTEALSETK